ncbi:MAG: GspE/PulE family protein [Candidatus Omnitrophica bacterium]|nr:GspE/PulE family protein [Candidatus Omnitrophota bacterium]MBU4478902.1 GspE/PulE family protein [Candidatus Omnitrophota bacterium]
MDKGRFPKSNLENTKVQAAAAEAAKGGAVVKIVNYVLTKAIESRASDIFIEPVDDAIQVRFRVDGVLQRFENFSLSIHSGIMGRLKVISDLDISEHRFPQDGRFKMKFPGKEVDFRISTMPSSLGERVVLRILDKERVILDVDKLGFDERAVNLLKAAMHKPYGMVLTCGPTGCGKTTTLYAAMKHIDSMEKNITTVEDPIEYQLHGINQLAVDANIGLTFETALRSILRQDPDIILVGEIRDSQPAQMAVRSALTGHLVLSSLHTATSSGAIVRLMNMGVEPFLIASSCLVVSAQILVRILCPQCKQRYAVPDAIIQEMEKYGVQLAEFKVERYIYKTKGCSYCSQTGYHGRTAIVEVLPISPEIKKLIEGNCQEIQIRKQAQREGMVTLRQGGLDLVLNGVTSLEEILRCTVADKK